MKKLASLKDAKVLSRKEQQLLKGGTYAWWECSKGSIEPGQGTSFLVWADGYYNAMYKSGAERCYLARDFRPS